MMQMRFNWFGLAAGILTLVVLIVSIFVPWWQLTVGDSLMQVNVSPFNTNFGMLSHQFTVPLIWAWNVATVLLFLATGIAMLFYSLNPTKSYGKELLWFSYRKPLYALILFIAGLFVILAAVGFFGFGIPVQGTSNIALPTQLMPFGVTVSMLVSAGFQLPFWLAVAAVVLCIAARIYHGRIFNIPETVVPGIPPPIPPEQSMIS